MLLAQISDTHVIPAGKLLYGRIDTAGHLAAAVRHLNALRPQPDFVMVTGDLVDGGAPDEYVNFRHIVSALDSPFCLLPGNHDDRANLRAAFSEHGYWPSEGARLHYVIEDLPLRLICLDTVLPGQSGGALGDEQMAWLARRLDERRDHPTVIAMHHPPFVSGLAGMDTINCADGEALGAVVARHPQVERIICGHIHRAMSIRWHGTLVTTAPGTAHQVALDLAENAPVSWITEPPGCHLHYWRPGRGLVTHLSFVGDYGAPVPY